MSFKKRILFYMLLIGIVYVTVELLSFAGVYFLTHDLFSFHSFHDLKKQIAEQPSLFYNEYNAFDASKNPANERIMLHPYFGYVFDPDYINRNLPDRVKNIDSDFGFWNDYPIIQKNDPQKLVVLFTGGSVAGQIVRHEHDHSQIADRLKSIPPFADQEILFLNTCIGGYKQPQQLMVLNFLMGMGAYYDIVVNIDGFNEIVLPAAVNIPQKVNPFFPRGGSWLDGIKSSPDEDTLRTVGKIALYEENRAGWAQFMNYPILRHSVTLNLLWKLYDRSALNHLQQIRAELQSTQRRDMDIKLNGPEFQYETENDMYKQLADFWKNCSIQMHDLCKGKKSRYFHILQPNQYVENSKPFSPEEQSRYLNNQRYQEPANQGYHYLINAGEELIDRGVYFCDLTMLFKDEPETVYSDNCCHFNSRGLEAIGKAIGDFIVNAYQSD